jgi:hypothetical protein
MAQILGSPISLPVLAGELAALTHPPLTLSHPLAHPLAHPGDPMTHPPANPGSPEPLVPRRVAQHKADAQDTMDIVYRSSEYAI